MGGHKFGIGAVAEATDGVKDKMRLVNAVETDRTRKDAASVLHHFCELFAPIRSVIFADD